MNPPSPPSLPPSKPPLDSVESSQPAVVASTGEVRRLARAMEQIARHCGGFFVEVITAVRRDRWVMAAILLFLFGVTVAGGVNTLVELRALRLEMIALRVRCGG